MGHVPALDEGAQHALDDRTQRAVLLGEALGVREEVVFQQTIFKEGAAAAEIYSIITGRVELCREAGQIELLGPGESFGTLAALTREPRFFTACALEHSRCLKLHRDTFWEILEAYPRVAHGVIKTLVRKVEALTRQAQAAK